MTSKTTHLEEKPSTRSGNFLLAPSSGLCSKNNNQGLLPLTVNGQKISTPPTHSVIQALWYAEIPRIKGVGCLDGVCGSCRILVSRTSSSEVTMELACQTNVEDGMQVIFPPFPEPSQHNYQLTDFKHSSEVQPRFHQIFPEATQCRRCSGCTESCPKGIDVEQGVLLAIDGRFRDAGELFIECVMCDMCMTSCPELIAPNHIGLFSRRITAYRDIRPSNLKQRLKQLEQGSLTVVEPENMTSPGQ